MAVVGELVEAQVGLDDQRVADLGRGDARRDVEDAVRVGRAGARRILVLGHAEEHDAADARRRGSRELGAQRLGGVLHDAGHRGDGLRLGRALGDEERQDELRRVHARLGREASPRGGRAQAAGTSRGEGAHSGYWEGHGCSGQSWRGARRAAPSDEQLVGDARRELGGRVVVGRHGVRARDALAAVRTVHARREEHQPVLEEGVGADRRCAAGLEAREDTPLRLGGEARGAVIETSGEMLVARAGLDGERALRRGGRPRVEREELGHGVEAADPLQPRGGEDDGVEGALRVVGGETVEPRVDVAADVDEHEIRAVWRRSERGGAVTRCRRGRRREAGEIETAAGADDVAGIRAPRHGGDREALGRGGRKVLEGVDDSIHFSPAQGVAERRREDAGSAERGEGLGRAVALRDDEHEFGAERVGDGSGLGARQGARARADAERHGRGIPVPVGTALTTAPRRARTRRCGAR